MTAENGRVRASFKNANVKSLQIHDAECLLLVIMDFDHAVRPFSSV